MLDLEDRILMNDGTSVIADERAVELLLKDGVLPEHMKVIPSKESTKFKQKYQKDIDYNGEESELVPDMSFDEREWIKLKGYLLQNRRDEETSIEDHVGRLTKELEYLEEYNQQSFILKVKALVDKFVEDEVVWGVGRGSSCASYVLFVLGIHDVNPITYAINASEFYKHIEE